MGEYGVSWQRYAMQMNRNSESAYFGGRKVLPVVARDRLGSARGNASPANHPYGENYDGASRMRVAAMGLPLTTTILRLSWIMRISGIMRVFMGGLILQITSVEVQG